MPFVDTYTLSALQVLCHLYTLHHSATDSVPAETQSPHQHQVTTLLPNGYVAYPDIGVALKYYNQATSLLEARSLCQQEGAQLAVIDSVAKMQHVKKQVSASLYVHAGIIRMDGRTWVNLNTGLPMSNITWHPGYPSQSNNCVQFGTYDSGLVNVHNCGLEDHYLCELPIFANSVIAAN